MVNYLAMLSIKLTRVGKKNLPSFRVVVVGTGSKIVETLGSYYPYLNPPCFQVAKERVEYWRKSGAHLSSTVDLLIKGKYEFKRYVPAQKESSSEAAKEPAAPAEGPVAEKTTVLPKAVEEKKEEKKENNPSQDQSDA